MELNKLSTAGTALFTWGKIVAACIVALLFVDARYATWHRINQIRLANGRTQIEENIEDLAKSIGELESRGESKTTQDIIALRVQLEELDRLKRDIEWLHVEIRE